MDSMNVDFGPVLTWILGPAGLMVIAQILKALGVARYIPEWARPLIGPILGALTALLVSLGFDVDLSVLEGVLMGTVAAVMFDSGKKLPGVELRTTKQMARGRLP